MTVLDGIAVRLVKALIATMGRGKAMKQTWKFGAAALGVLLLGHFFWPQGVAPSFAFNASEQASEVNVAPDASSLSVDVAVNHGRLLLFDEPVESVFLAEPSIADIKVIWPVENSENVNPRITRCTAGGEEFEGPQVNLRVRFVEIPRSELKALGINGYNFDTSDFSIVRISAEGPHHADANALLDALQRNGVVNILAEPALTAVTGQTVCFLAGGDFPIVVPQSGGATTTEYKTYGVSLVFTPTIIETNRIALHVHPEVSTVSMTAGVKVGGVEVPVILVRRTNATIELASGQTFAIGGLFQRQLSQSADDMDKLAVGDLPVIGPLFRSPRFRRNETELVIFVTPYLVDPISDARAPATPLDRPPPMRPGSFQAPPLTEDARGTRSLQLGREEQPGL